MSSLRTLLPSPNALFVFEAAARNQSFKEAARELNVTQPSISYAIKALEEHCGIALFLRSNRGIRLTAPGRALYEEVRAGFDRIEAGMQAISGARTKYVTIAVSSSLAAHWLTPQLYSFQAAHPGIRLKVVATDRDVEPDDEIDLTIWIRRKDFQRKNSWYLCDEVIFPVCSPLYLSKGPVTDLPAHRLLHSTDAFRQRMDWPEWMRLSGGDAGRVEPDIVLGDYQLALQSALTGEGIALGWSLTVQMLLQNGMLLRPVTAEVRTDRAFFLLAGDSLALNRDARGLIDWILGQTRGLRQADRAAAG